MEVILAPYLCGGFKSIAYACRYKIFKVLYHQLFYLFLQAGAVPHFLYEEYHTLYHTDIKIPFNEIHTSDKIIVSTYCIKGYL